MRSSRRLASQQGSMSWKLAAAGAPWPCGLCRCVLAGVDTQHVPVRWEPSGLGHDSGRVKNLQRGVRKPAACSHVAHHPVMLICQQCELSSPPLMLQSLPLWTDAGDTASYLASSAPPPRHIDPHRCAHSSMSSCVIPQETGCTWTGITISKAQLEEATLRVKAAGLADRIKLLFCDYRDCKGQFDAVVSCEMIEAVGQEHLAGFFQAIGRLVRPGGSAVVQVIMHASVCVMVSVALAASISRCKRASRWCFCLVWIVCASHDRDIED